MSTPAPVPNTNRFLLAISIPLLLVLIFLVGWVASRLNTPPTPPDTSKELERKLDELLSRVGESLTKAPAPSVSTPSLSDKDVKNALAQVNKDVGSIADQLRQQILLALGDEKLARERGDLAAAEMARQQAELSRKQQEELEAKLAEYERERRKAVEEKRPLPPPPDFSELAGADKSDRGKEIGKSILRLGVYVLCAYYPVAAPILLAIAAEIGLFGNENEVRDKFLQAVRDVTEGRAVNSEVAAFLAQAAKDNKIPPKMGTYLNDLVNATGNKPEVRSSVGGILGAIPFPIRPPTDLVADISKAIRATPTRTLDDIRLLFPTEAGNPYYRSEAQKEQVERLFDGEPELAARYWDLERGLKTIKPKVN